MASLVKLCISEISILLCEEYYVCILAVNEADNEIILRRLADQDYSAMDRPDNSVMLAKILVTRE